MEVYLDGGIRNGTDIFKALALGAKAVFIGRPILWGLAYMVGINTIAGVLSPNICGTSAYLVITTLSYKLFLYCLVVYNIGE